MDQALPENIAVIGPGLIGGSLLLGLRQRHPAASIRAWVRRSEAVSELQKIDPAIAASTDLKTVVAGAGLIVLCTPVASMPAIAKQLATMPLEPGCIITDAGSVKSPVVTALEGIFSKTSASFIGSHPMAGSERSGISASRAKLFDGSVCILTPTLFTSDKALAITRKFWSLLGCRILEMQPEEHDRKIARISHLPHLAAIAVTLAALRRDKSAADCAGNGFRDVTRIASGDPELWTGIISQNRAEIISALKDAHDITGDLLAIISSEDDSALLRLLQEARSLRNVAGPV
ncbi:MAG: prephenate dehydrogenase/arogenate dehydrogenase family protein [Verrucomicrobia bacterium]|nr:prephenate dehydrogenase/arogenate dehydrogenase family protein [Verrucomicrobiota bacterium]